MSKEIDNDASDYCYDYRRHLEILQKRKYCDCGHEAKAEIKHSRENRKFVDVQINGKLTRNEIAYNLAIKLADKFGFSEPETFQLQTIFDNVGLYKTCVAVEPLFDQGVSVDEIVLASSIRQLWEELYSNNYGLSWPDAMTVVKSFAYNSVPDLSEVERFFTQISDEFNDRLELSDSFHNFYKYFRYRLGDTSETLNFFLEWTFEPSYFSTDDDDDGDDDDDVENQNYY